MRVIVLFSGGKDSVFATFFSLFQGWDVSLLTLVPQDDSMMFHRPNVELTSLQAQALGLMHRQVNVTNETELKVLERELATLKPDAIITGAIASEYQKQRIDQIGYNLKIPTISPLWHKGDALLQELTEFFEIHITTVAAQGLGEEHLGKKFDSEFVQKLQSLGLNPFFEGGEGETFVSNAPFFKSKIEITGMEKKFDGSRGIAKLSGAISRRS
jgi:ABC transporter with metal-binding/Fe-S-binding domain ATP-binding protein